MTKGKPINLLEAKHVSYYYVEGTLIINDVNLTVNKGDFLSILGSSGSGKTTLLSILSGLERPKSGEVVLKGNDLAKLKEKELSKLRRRDIGFVFQFYNLSPYLTLEENILSSIYLDGRKKQEVQARLDYLLDFLAIRHRKDAYPSQCSGGEQQRAALARALVYSPSILFLDEPTGNLDSTNATKLMDMLRQINEQDDVTVIQVTHSETNAGYGNRIIRLKDGKTCDVDPA